MFLIDTDSSGVLNTFLFLFLIGFFFNVVFIIVYYIIYYQYFLYLKNQEKSCLCEEPIELNFFYIKTLINMFMLCKCIFNCLYIINI